RGSNLTLRNLTFDGRAIFCDREHDEMVSELNIDNCWFHLDVAGDHDNAIEFTTGIADGRITNCVFYPIKGDNGIYGYNWNKLVIANNLFMNGQEGIHLVAHFDPSKDLLIEQNYFANLRRMGVEYQGGGKNTIVQDNYYEKPVMTKRFEENTSTFAYSIVADRSISTIVRRNTSIAPERPDGAGVRIIFELGGHNFHCLDNYSIGGQNVVSVNGTNATGTVHQNRFAGFLNPPTNYNGAQAVILDNGPDIALSWDINRGKPGPNKRLATNK
ncbi:MAG TPA: right-handed parallel beta-helix repeat-containing protein, partial [Tepidisphaeraceae bacterium]|nr:right-handed parallel beta-helix repeat-containing protein [Tepidisphaeraceae bacterium]